MSANKASRSGFRLPILQGVLPFQFSQIPAELIAGLTLAALAIPEVMGYTKISGTPVISELYTMLIPTALFALFGSSRHLVVGADSATAAILAAGLVGMASVGSDHYLALAGTGINGGRLPVAGPYYRSGFSGELFVTYRINWFLTGVGIQVALGEIGGMLGLKDEGRRAKGMVLYRN